MKLCRRAQEIKAGWETDQRSFRIRVDNYEHQGDVPRAEAAQGMLATSKGRMAQALNRHLSRCKECG